MTTPPLSEARERLEACADDLHYGAISLREDTRPNEPNADLHYRIADQRQQWAADLRALLAHLDALEAENAKALALLVQAEKALEPFAAAYQDDMRNVFCGRCFTSHTQAGGDVI